MLDHSERAIYRLSTHLKMWLDSGVGRKPTIETACANWYCTAARSSEQRAQIGSALRLGHRNSVRHSVVR